MIRLSLTQSCHLGIAGLALALAAGGCSSLRPPETPQPSFYALESLHGETGAAASAAATLPGAMPTLIVNPPYAASGFDSQRIIYVRTALQLEYFAHSEWIDTPARMLAPLIVSTIETRNAFRAVVLTPSAAAGDLMLDTEILRLQQDFSNVPSRVRFTLRAYIEDSSTRRVLAWREFDATVAAASDNPYGGVVAANRAVQTVLKQLADFCTETVANRQALAHPGAAP